MIVILAALTSGVMFYLSQGYAAIWPLAWFAPAPLLWLAYGKTPLWQVMAASAVAILAGLGYILQSSYGLPLIVSLLPALAFYGATFCVAVWFARFVQRRATPIATLFAFPALWTAIEFLSELHSPNGTYGSFAYATMAAPLLIQSASLLGMYAVTFLLCLFANTLAMALRANRETAVAIGVGVAICAANLVFGFVRLAQPQPDTLRVAALVDETAVADSWRAHSLADDLKVTNRYAGEIRQAALEGAKFVVTPEGGMASIPQSRNTIAAPLAAVSRQTGVQIVAGFHAEKPPADFALSITPNGAVYRYDKRHRVPVLEDRYVPGRVSGWLGHGRAMEICKDMDFPGTIRADAAKGVRLVGAPAGDFGIDGWQHGRMAIMRGVENGFALVRAAHHGLVYASDAQGRLIAVKTAAPTGPTMIIADLPLGPGPTLYTRIGNTFPWLCLVLFLSIGGYCIVRGKRDEVA